MVFFVNLLIKVDFIKRCFSLLNYGFAISSLLLNSSSVLIPGFFLICSPSEVNNLLF